MINSRILEASCNFTDPNVNICQIEVITEGGLDVGSWENAYAYLMSEPRSISVTLKGPEYTLFNEEGDEVEPSSPYDDTVTRIYKSGLVTVVCYYDGYEKEVFTHVYNVKTGTWF